MTVLERKELQDAAYEAGYEDGARGAPEFTSLAKNSPFTYSYGEGYNDGTAERQRRETQEIAKRQ